MNKDSSQIATEKDKFELAEDKLLDSFIEKFSLLESSQLNKLIPDSIKKAKIKEDLRKSIKCLDLDINLGPAFEILIKDRHLHIEEDRYEEMVTQLLDIPVYIEKIDLSQPVEEKLYILFQISQSTMQSILNIGLAKYNEEEFEASLSIFYLLSALDRNNADYWYRLGIVAIQTEKLNLALQGFAYAIYLNREFMGARIFSAQCYIKLGEIENAKAELVEIKKNSAKISSERIWRELIANIEYDLKVSK